LGECFDLAPACREVTAAIRRLAAARERPVLAALDGGSGSAKSTLARMIAAEVDGARVPLDDFYAAWDKKAPRERVRDVFDWARLRAQALEPLLAGRRAAWQIFDFRSGPRSDGTYGMSPDWVCCDPAPAILLDGAYSTGPALADLVDLAVLVDAPVEVRHARLAAREEAGFLRRWHARWDAVEAVYFTRIRPPGSFDLVVRGG